MTPLPEEQFRVHLHDQLVGRLHRRGDFTRFVFEPDYWDDPNRAVLGLRFEDNPRARHQSHLRLPPWFSNLLPEGRLRDWIARARGTAIEREMELLAQVGHDLPGAVRVIAADERDRAQVEIHDGDAPTTEPDHPANPLWRFSLAGVGLKFSMLSKGDRLVVPGFGQGGDWIVKMPDAVYPDLPWNEWAMMILARATGIDAPEVRLLHRDQVENLPKLAWAGGSYAYAVKRFDRGPQRELIHIEDLAQVRGFYPWPHDRHEGKYAGSFETVGALIYRRHDVKALQEFARRLAFNILIGNGDAHLKNWSLIYRNPRIPTLAPAYDLVGATFFYCPSPDGPEEMALKFGRSKRFDDARISMLARLDEKLGAKADLADVARITVDRVRAEWPQAEALLQDHLPLAREIKSHIEERSKSFLR